MGFAIFPFIKDCISFLSPLVAPEGFHYPLWEGNLPGCGFLPPRGELLIQPAPWLLSWQLAGGPPQLRAGIFHPSSPGVPTGTFLNSLTNASELIIDQTSCLAKFYPLPHLLMRNISNGSRYVIQNNPSIPTETEKMTWRACVPPSHYSDCQQNTNHQDLFKIN